VFSFVLRGSRSGGRWLVAGLVTVVVLLIFLPIPRPGSYAYQTEPVERGSVQTLITAVGTVSPVTTTRVSSQLSGQVAELLVDFNDTVQKGQLLARLDPQSFQAEVRETGAELEVAQAKVLAREAAVEQMAALLDKKQAERSVSESETASDKAKFREARLGLERKRALAKRKLVSQSDLDEAQARLDSARALFKAAEARQRVQDAEIRDAQATLKMAEADRKDALAVVKQRQAALERAEVDLARTAIRAPIDGIVIRRDVDAGQTVAASLQAPTLFTLAEDLARMQVEARVDEADIGQISPGQPVLFTVEAYPERKFDGTVVQIRKAPETFQHVVTYNVIVAAANPDLALLPGMTALVRIVAAEAEGVLKVPNAALRFTPPDGATRRDRSAPAEGGNDAALPDTVWVLDDGTPRAIAVRAGARDSRFSAVLGGGLREGDEVVTAWLPEP